MQFRLKPKSSFATMAMLLVMVLPYGVAQAASEKTKENQEPLTITLSLKRVTIDGQGKETLVDAAKVKPGDLLEYEAIYANVGRETLQHVQATLPVPDGMEYQGRTARPMPVLAATSSANFAAEPLMRKVKDKDGRDKLEPVPLAEYRKLRWVVKSVEPGKRFVVSARMRVPQNAVSEVTRPFSAQGAAVGKQGSK